MILLFICATSLAAAPAVNVFESGSDGYHTFRIPSLLATSKGTLLAFAEGRKNGRSDSGQIDLVLKRSIDSGQTWSALSVVASDPPHTIGNPCAVVDRDTGTIWLLMTRNLGSDIEKDIIAGRSKDTRRVLISSSNDDGVSWAKPLDITASTKLPDWTWYATGPGVGIQLKSGRLLIPCDHREKGSAKYRSHVIFSDDHAKTWKIGGVVGEDVNECQAVELADGSVMINMRSYRAGQHCRAISISKDGGESWSQIADDQALIEPNCQASLIRFAGDATHKPFLAFSNPASQQKREKLTLRLSRDEGKNWTESQLLYAGSAAYSCLAIVSNLSVGCLYEHDDYRRISFALISFEQPG